jgi:hypothetical protein
MRTARAVSLERTARQQFTNIAMPLKLCDDGRQHGAKINKAALAGVVQW